MQKRAAYPRLEREGRQRGNEKEVPGWNNKKMVGGGKQSGKASDRGTSRDAHSRLCKRYAISDKWRGRERNRDEERARPLASHRRSLPSTQLTCPPSRFAGTMAAVLENVSTALSPLLHPGTGRGKKNTAWTGTKIRRRSPFPTWAFLARGARRGRERVYHFADSSFPCERWPNDRTDEENIARTGKHRDSSCKSDPSFHTPLRSFIC